MADFKKYYPTLQRNEGGYANNPKDPGGETWAGVARRYNPKWPGWKRVDTIKAKFFLPTATPAAIAITGLAAKDIPAANKLLCADAQLADMVYQFYKVNYWNSLQLDFVNSQPLAEQLADHGVNAGAMRPAKMVQSLVNEYMHVKHTTGPKGLLKVDGDIGPDTVTTINWVDQRWLYAAFVQMRRYFYLYRAGKGEQVPRLYETFFAEQLNLRPKADQVQFLSSWLSRCQPATLPV